MDGFQVLYKCLELASLGQFRSLHLLTCLETKFVSSAETLGEFVNFDKSMVSRTLNALIFPPFRWSFLPHFTESHAMEAAAGPNSDLSTTVQPGMLTNAGDLNHHGSANVEHPGGT